MLAAGRFKAGTAGLRGYLPDPGANFGRGRTAANGLNSRRGLARLALNERDEEVDGLGQASEGDCAEQD